MKIAKLNGNSVQNEVSVQEVGEHRSLFPKISFPSSGPNAEWLSANSCAVVKINYTCNDDSEKIAESSPFLQDGVVHTKRVSPLTDEDFADRIAELEARLRGHRELNLLSSDWVVTKALESGTPVPTAWVTYRTALRDITSHANWPNLQGDDWPTLPS